MRIEEMQNEYQRLVMSVWTDGLLMIDVHHVEPETGIMVYVMTIAADAGDGIDPDEFMSDVWNDASDVSAKALEDYLNGVERNGF